MNARHYASEHGPLSPELSSPGTLSSDLLDFSGSNTSQTIRQELIDVLFGSAAKKLGPMSCNPQAILHTRTIPLASSIHDDYYRQEALRPLEMEQISHDFCEENHCCYPTGYERQLLACPCSEALPNVPRICFFEFLRRVAERQFGQNPQTGLWGPEHIPICFDHKSIFDLRYPTYIRELTRRTGFSKRNSRIYETLLLTRWFYPHRSHHRVKRLIEKFSSLPKGIADTAFRHTIYTMDSTLVKLFIAFPDFLWSNQFVDEITFRLFIELGEEYACLKLTGAYTQLKDWANHTKQQSLRMTKEGRRACLQIPPGPLTEILNRFQGFFSSLCAEDYLTGQDYTESLSFIYRTAVLSQTRNLGYLPFPLCEEKRVEYHSVYTLSNGDRPPTAEQSAHHRRLMRSFLRRKLPNVRNLFKEPDKHQKILSDVHTYLKPSASQNSSVLEGGRMKDAQEILHLCQGIEIPVRNLNDLEIESLLTIGKVEDLTHKYLFWISFQAAINKLASLGYKKFIPHYRGIPIEYWDILDATVIYIKEPGKVRPLTKGSSILYWVCSPYAQILQNVISTLEEAKLGLRGSWQGYWHYANCSKETSFFDSNSGILRPEVCNLSTDFTSASDYLFRNIVRDQVLLMSDWLAAPTAYVELYVLLQTLPNPITEWIPTLESYVDDDQLQDEPSSYLRRKKTTALMVRGMPMGMIGTKPILTLQHLLISFAVREHLEDRGFRFTVGTTDYIPTVDKEKVFNYLSEEYNTGFVPNEDQLVRSFLT